MQFAGVQCQRAQAAYTRRARLSSRKCPLAATRRAPAHLAAESAHRIDRQTVIEVSTEVAFPHPFLLLPVGESLQAHALGQFAIEVEKTISIKAYITLTEIISI